MAAFFTIDNLPYMIIMLFLIHCIRIIFKIYAEYQDRQPPTRFIARPTGT